MSAAPSESTGPDLTQGVPIDTLADGAMLAGHVGDDAVLLARRGNEFFAIGATCTHYNGPLAEGLMVDDTVRCPWHHACFSLRTGEALHAPALAPVACWTTEQRDGNVYVRDKVERTPRIRITPAAGSPKKIVIVGGGAAGFAAAEMLRRQRYEGSIVMLSDDAAPPVDRPNLSKDYLAGTAPEEWVPLRDDVFYADQHIDLRLKTTVTAIDTSKREVIISDGGRIAYDRLLLATGAEPVRLPLPGMDLPHVHTLRTLADSRTIIAQAAKARSAVVMGASFIGLEVAASLRARGIEVHVVAPDKRPMERVLGAQMGDFVRSLHEEHGVIFHLEDTATAIDASRVTLKSGGTIAADLVVVGVGVRPRLQLAQDAGLAIDRGVTVDEFLRDQCARRLRGRRHRPLARPAHRCDDPRRALGRRRAARPDRGAQHARRPAAIRRRAVLLEPALRRADQLRRARRGVGRRDGRRRHREARLRRALSAQRPRARSRFHLSRPREPHGGSGDGASRGRTASGTESACSDHSWQA